jgi:transposase-like protein
MTRKDSTMTKATIASGERAEQGADPDLLRQMIRFVAQRMMDMDVEALCGAGYDVKSAERTNRRNGYRERALGDAGGQLLPALPGVAAHDRESHGGGDPGGLYPGRVHALRTVFAQDSEEDARKQWRTVSDPMRERFPRLAALRDGSEHEVLAHMAFPKPHRQQIHSTNALERLNAEVKRRTDVVGIFPNEAAIVRLVGAMLLEQNDEWSLQRRYMPLEDLQSLSNNQAAKRSAVIS